MNLRTLLVLCAVACLTALNAQSTGFLAQPFSTTTYDLLPAKDPIVIRMDKQSTVYERLNETYTNSLLNMTNNDLQTAFNIWRTTLIEMQDYANKVNFPLKGIKMWIKVYCNKKGKIKHIAFLPTPDSRNIPDGFLDGFLERFAKGHKMSIKAKGSFAHYGVASFPL